jgi:AcrR family transcriptional regulator
MSGETKDQILDAAERLFSESGIDATPLRRIIAEAGVNAAAIHYHFGSKEGLVRAVFARRFDPLNRERIAMLGEVERQAGSGPLQIEDVLTALVAPAVRLGGGSEAGRSFRRLVGRVFGEREDYTHVIFNDVFHELEQRFDAACHRALPDLPEEERSWRKHLAIGAMVHVLREQDFICAATGGVCDLSDVDRAIRHIVAFMAAGFKAPAGTKTGEPAFSQTESHS